MKRIVIVFFLICLAGSNVMTKAQSECCAWAQGGDASLRIVRRCCYMPVSITNSCCDGSPGVGYCETNYYYNGEFLSHDFYYADGYTIQQSYCGYMG
jgi:hypothetical protein